MADGMDIVVGGDVTPALASLNALIAKLEGAAEHFDVFAHDVEAATTQAVTSVARFTAGVASKLEAVQARFDSVAVRVTERVEHNTAVIEALLTKQQRAVQSEAENFERLQQRKAFAEKASLDARARLEAEYQAKAERAQREATLRAAQIERAGDLATEAEKAESRNRVTALLLEGEARKEAILKEGELMQLAVESDLNVSLLRLQGEYQATSERLAAEHAAKMARQAKEAQKAQTIPLGHGHALERAGDALITGGALSAVPLIAATAAASDFNTEFLKAVNNTTLTNEQAVQLRQNVKALIAEGTDQPLDKLFSAGMRAANFRQDGQTIAQTMDIMRVGVHAATAQFSDAEKTTEMLAREMHIFKIPVSDASATMNLLIEAARQTNQTLEQFQSNFGRVAEDSAVLGASLADTAAVYSLLTKNGNTAAQSATATRAIFKSLVEPTGQVKDRIVELSKTHGDLSKFFGVQNLQANNLIGSLEGLSKALGGNKEQLLSLFPDMRSSTKALYLMTSGSGDLVKQLDDEKRAFRENTIYQENYRKVTENAAFGVKALENQAISLGDSFSHSLLPYVKQGVQFSEALLNRFDKLSPSEKQLTVNVLAGAAAFGLLTGGLVKTLGAIDTLVTGGQTLARVVGAVSARLAAMEAATAAATTASAELATAETAAGTAGAAAFGPASLVIAALVGLGIELWHLKGRWDEMRQAQDEAAQSAQNYADKLKGLQASGERGALIANQREIANKRGDVKDAIDAQRDIRRQIQAAKQRGDFGAASNLDSELHRNEGGRFGDTAPGGLGRMTKWYVQAGRDYETETRRLKAMSAEGSGAANRALMAVGGDGFAKSVIGHAFDSISLPTNIATCARFVSEVFARAGANIKPGTLDRAGDLVMWAAQHGAKKHTAMKDALPGDLVSFTGRNYGAHGSGHHVGIYLGNGMMRESPHAGRITTQSVAGELAANGGSVAFYTVPGSTFTNAPAPSLPGRTGTPAPTSHLKDWATKGRKKGSASLPALPVESPFDPLRDLSSDTTDGNLNLLHRPFTAKGLAKNPALFADAMAAIDAWQAKMTQALGSELTREQEIGVQLTANEMRRKRAAEAEAVLGGKGGAVAKAQATQTAAAEKYEGAYKRYDAAFRQWQGAVLTLRAAMKGGDEQAIASDRRSADSLARKVQVLKSGVGGYEQLHKAATRAADVFSTEAATLRTVQGTLRQTAFSTAALTLEKKRLAEATDKANKAMLTGLTREGRNLVAKTDFDEQRDSLRDHTQEERDAAKAAPVGAADRRRAMALIDTIEREGLAKIQKAESDYNAQQDREQQRHQDEIMARQFQSQKLSQDAYLAYLTERYKATVNGNDEDQAAAEGYWAKMFQIEDDGLKQQLARLNENYEANRLTRQQYLGGLYGVQGQAEGHPDVLKDVQGGFDAVQKKAEETAHKVADKVTDMVMQVARRARTLKQVLGDAFKEALDAFEKRAVNAGILKLVESLFHTKDAAKLTGQSEADKHVAAATLYDTATDKLALIVGAFARAVSEMGAAMPSGASGLLGGGGLSPILNLATGGKGGGGGILGGGLGGVLGSVAPWAGAALGVIGLLGGLFGGGAHKPDYVTNTAPMKYSDVLGRDYSSTVDSGYSGAGGLRTLLGTESAGKAGVVHIQPVVHVEAGAVVAHGVQDADALSKQLVSRITKDVTKAVAEDALWGHVGRGLA